MSAILQYFKSLFINPNNSRKRRRTEHVIEEQQFPIKYRRVSNIFPKTYTSPIEDALDYVAEVKQKKSNIENYLGSFIMDQQEKQFKAVLEDGEFSDEDDISGHRILRQQKKYCQNSTRSTTRTIHNSQSLTNFTPSYRNPVIQPSSTSSAFGENSLSLSKASNLKSRGELPKLIPIGKSNDQVNVTSSSFSTLSNGCTEKNEFKSANFTSPGAFRSTRSIIDVEKKLSTLKSTPTSSIQNSVITQQNQMEVKEKYNDLLMQLDCYKSKTSIQKPLQNEFIKNDPIATIDLCDENNSLAKSRPLTAINNISLSKFILSKEIHKHDMKKSYGNIIDLSDDNENDNHDDCDATAFAHGNILSSTILKSPINKAFNRTFNNFERKQQQHVESTRTSFHSLGVVEFKQVNSLKEKQSLNRACEPDVIDKVCKKFQESRQIREKTIVEEEKKAQRFERERIEHERQNQKRIEDSFLNAILFEKCILIDEEDVIDEFPPLTDTQNKLVNYALHGNRTEVIVSKFKMDVTRYDLATLEGLNWLNDMVINFYLELIKERSELVDYLPRVHVMNTVFLGKLLEQGYSSVRRWTRKVDIFSYDIIPVPVHVGGVHWCMSIIHLKNKTIKYYDSMGHPNFIVLETLKNYLMEESLDKKKIHFDMSDWTLECVRDCPMQKNGSDCGVFSCQFAEFIARDSKITFEQQHMPYIRRKMIYEIASGKLLL